MSPGLLWAVVAMPGVQSRAQAPALPPTSHVLTSTCVARLMVTCIPPARGRLRRLFVLYGGPVYFFSSRNVDHSLRLAIALPHKLTTAKCTVVIVGYGLRSAGP